VMSISDELMFTYYELVTDVPRDAIAGFKAGIKDKSLHPKAVKVNLAKEICAQFYDKDAAERAAQEFEAIFVKKDMPDEIADFVIPSSEVTDGKIRISRVMALAELAKSISEARRLIQGGGVSFEGAKIEDENFELVLPCEGILKVGKRRFVRVKSDN
ncbi:MAG: S4 domain-containing protein, partial [Spirochaetota bacterium]